MARVFIIPVLILTLLLSACTSTAYKDQMKLGNQALAENRYEDAVAAFSSALQEEPKQAEAKERLQEAQKRLLDEKMTDALSQAQEAFDHQNYSSAIDVLTKVQSQFKDEALARDYLDQVAALLRKATVQNQIMLGKTALLANRFDDAIQSFEAVLQNAPDNSEVQGMLAEAQKKQQERQAELQRALARMVKEQDPLTGTVWYIHRNEDALIHSPIGNLSLGIYMYISLAEGQQTPSLRFVSRYYGDNWVFYKTLLFRIDDSVYSLPADPQRDNGGGKVWEYEDADMNPTAFGVVSAIIQSQEDVLMRFVGDARQYDLKLDDYTKTELRETLEAYEALGGDLSQYGQDIDMTGIDSRDASAAPDRSAASAAAQPDNEGSGGSTPEPDAGWNTYQNARFGFTLQYPVDWKKGEESANGDGIELSLDSRADVVASASLYLGDEFLPDLSDFTDFKLANGKTAKSNIAKHDGKVEVNLYNIKAKSIVYKLMLIFDEDYYHDNQEMIQKMMASWDFFAGLEG